MQGYNLAPSINLMKKAGLNDTQISMIIQDIRSTSINEEFLRIQNLLAANPPTHLTTMETQHELGDYL